jgi:hypothetical protein
MGVGASAFTLIASSALSQIPAAIAQVSMGQPGTLAGDWCRQPLLTRMFTSTKL